ncbi:protein kintoun [Parasteatoda tepidariorum]|uniref:protein kintoun n=1 Tax=Parasteatoda tepidariorum TaxID=114398 RepID=UPI001C724ADF|nr:protein kintoun [Parasteatoda tepidariorum]
MDEDFVDKLKLTSDEATKLKNAFQNKDFVKLFQEYAENVTNPDSRKQYESEIISMEKERGFKVKFIHPSPLYVMKYIVNGEKLFINVCENEHVREANFERKISGTECQIPVILSKPRQDYDNKKEKCTVIDVMFHPETMQLAEKNPRFKRAVEDTARTTIANQFGFAGLTNGKYPKLKYKGVPPSLILRQNAKGLACECESLKDYCKRLTIDGKNVEAKLMKKGTKVEAKLTTDAKEVEAKLTKDVDAKLTKDANEVDAKLTEGGKKVVDSYISSIDSTPKQPQYSVKYRDVIDMKDYSVMGYTDLTAPKAIILDVHLPGVEGASEIDVAVLEKKFKLKSKSEKNHSYSLEVDFSYIVNKDSGTAKFAKATKILTVTLPVRERGIPVLNK